MDRTHEPRRGRSTHVHPADVPYGARSQRRLRGVLSELAGRRLAAGQIVLGVPLLEQAAAREGNALRHVRVAIDQLCKGEARARAAGETTFAEFAERALSGKLAEQL